MTSQRGYRVNHAIEESMIDNELVGRTDLVTGTRRGFGQGVSIALAAAGVRMIGLARSRDRLDALATEIGDAFTPVAADATDPELAQSMLAEHHPDVLVLNAGATPPLAPIHEQNWESFTANWTVDTRDVFEWIRAAVESERARLGISFRTLFPQLASNTELGAAGVAGYVARQGIPVKTFAKNFEPARNPEQSGAAAMELVTTNDPTRKFLISGHGLRQVPS
jgi:NAD(P)-dependent dehydrogenase (short-subunit alcohol dehydrogenase family)